MKSFDADRVDKIYFELELVSSKAEVYERNNTCLNSLQ
jgi:hypothetical protein